MGYIHSHTRTHAYTHECIIHTHTHAHTHTHTASWRQQTQQKSEQSEHGTDDPLPPLRHQPAPTADFSPRGQQASEFERKLGGTWAQRVARIYCMGRALGLVLLSLCIPATVLLRVVVCQVLFFFLFFRVSGAIFISFLEGGSLPPSSSVLSCVRC